MHVISLLLFLISLFTRAFHHIARRFMGSWYQIYMYTLRTHRPHIEMFRYNITLPVALCLSVGIADSPFKPIYFSLYEGISPIPYQSNGFLLLLHPSRWIFYKYEMWQNCGRGEETEQDWDSNLVGVKPRFNNSAQTFFCRCRPRLVKTITMSLIFSVFSTKARCPR